MSLALPFTIVGTATLASRVTGFVRDILIAAILGAGPVTDVYVAAFLLPNLFRRMMSDGAFNAAIVPRLARLEQESGAPSARGFALDALSLLSVVVIVLVAVAELAMPGIMGVIAHGFRDDSAKFADAVLFGRIAFPFVGLILIVALMSALLNAAERYAIAALVPVVLNLLLIGVLVALLAFVEVSQRQAGLVLITTVLAAGVVQLGLLWWAAARAGFDVRPRPLQALRGRIDPAAKTMLLLALPGMVIAGSGHVHMIVASQFASFEPRAVSWLYFADRLFQLPLGFVASAIGVVLLPRIARALQQGEEAMIADAQSESLVFAGLLIFPASAGLYVLADPIVTVLFQRAAFTAADAAATAANLRLLAIALPGFVAVKIILPAFLARERMRTPLLAVAAAIAANVGGVLALRASLPHLAPACGVAIGAWANAIILAIAVGGSFLVRPLTYWRLLASFAAAAIMGVAVAWLAGLAAPWLDPARGLTMKASALTGLCLAGIGVFLALARLLGAYDARLLRRRAG